MDLRPAWAGEGERENEGERGREWKDNDVRQEGEGDWSGAQPRSWAERGQEILFSMASKTSCLVAGGGRLWKEGFVLLACLQALEPEVFTF